MLMMTIDDDFNDDDRRWGEFTEMLKETNPLVK